MCYFLDSSHIIKQMLEFLPENVQSALKYLNRKDLYEIRLRADRPVFINYKGDFAFLSAYGLTDCLERAISVSKLDIENVVHHIGRFSVYSIENQIRQGFITAEGGVRVGLAGEYVIEKNSPLTIRNISSLCIRIPHAVVGAGNEIFYRCMSDRVVNLLVASLPGCGKTTILRDLACILSKIKRKNILICDERGEISAFDVGETCDVLLYADKAIAFEAGIRALRPDVIVTDELSGQDVRGLEMLVRSGISVIASIHADCFERLPKGCLDSFEKIVFLQAGKVGVIESIFEKSGGEWRMMFGDLVSGDA